MPSLNGLGLYRELCKKKYAQIFRLFSVVDLAKVYSQSQPTQKVRIKSPQATTMLFSWTYSYQMAVVWIFFQRPARINLRTRCPIALYSSGCTLIFSSDKIL
ncbi:MAG: hypothetical protein ACI8ZB_005000 [Desulforhopalus sp.]|jgi:hypothetical protein